MHDNKLSILYKIYFVLPLHCLGSEIISLWNGYVYKSVLGHILDAMKKQEKNISNLKVGIGNYEKELL